jgi:hypothetical protein
LGAHGAAESEELTKGFETILWGLRLGSALLVLWACAILTVP